MITGKPYCQGLLSEIDTRWKHQVSRMGMGL
jgi:hypothetical protein